MDEVEHRVVSLGPDLIVFVETWLDSDIPDSCVSLPDYSIIRKDRNKFGGGIAVYVAVSLEFEILNISSVQSSHSCETEILTILFPSLNMVLIAIYHPFWKDSLRNECAITCISDIIDHVLTFPSFDSTSTKIVLSGDFNDLVTHVDVLENSFGLERKVFMSTRGNRTLDHIFSNIRSDCQPKVFPPLGRSDHSVVMWDPNKARKPVTTKKRIRNLSKANKRKFEITMCLVNWNLIKNFGDTQLAMNVFHSVLCFIYDACFPWITVRFRSNDPPWMNASLKILMDKRDNAFCKNHRSKYCRLRANVITYIRVLKRNYLLEIESASNTRDSWKRLKTISRHNKANVLSSGISAAMLNEHFSSVFQSSDPLSLSSYDIDSLPDVSLEVSDLEIHSHLIRLKKGCGGPDGLPFWVFKNNSLLLASVIADIFNRFLSIGHFPVVFKYADIVPIPKVPSPSSPSDFRPISMLPVLSKVLERIVVSHWILPHVSSKLSDSQFAYVPGPGKGTTTALTFISHLTLKFLDGKSGAVRMLAADFSKAFDKLTFDAIVSALINFHVPRQAVCFLLNFLRDRKQRVRLSDDVSDWSPITSGVPQGSVLGPILFSLVIDSYSPVCENSVCIKFADDVTVLHFVRSDEDDLLQREWIYLKTWSTSVGLCLNLSKSSVMNYVTKKSLTLAPILSDDGVPIPTVSSLRLLGVTFSCDFTWNAHVQNVVNKCYKRFYILRNLRRAGCPPSLVHKCYVAFIRNVLLYSFSCFCNLPKYLFHKILCVERRAARYFPGLQYSDLYDSTDRICKKLFRSVVKFSNHPLRAMFVPRLPTKRNACILSAPRTKTTRFFNSFIRYGRF
jgi:hypothetical protein